MSSRASLERLPVEVVETIVVLLNFTDVCNIRLTAREVASKASQGSFRSYFLHKRLELSHTQLTEFCHMTQGTALGCLLEDLTLVSIAQPAGPANEQTASNAVQSVADVTSNGSSSWNDEKSVDFLSQALKNLQERSTDPALRRLSLTVDCRDQDGSSIEPSQLHNWTAIGTATADAFRLTARSLAAARLSVHDIDLFGSCIGCSLELNQFASIVEQIDLATSLRHITALSASLTHQRSSTFGSSPQSIEGVATAVEHFLTKCANLQILELHWYNLRLPSQADIARDERRFFDHIAGLVYLPSLATFKLKGVYVSEQAIISFLRAHTKTLRRIEIEDLHLESGGLRPVFDCITNQLKGVEHLYLDDLWETGTLVQFKDGGVPHFVHPGGSTHLTRDDSMTGKSIEYHRLRGRIKGSSKASRWAQRRTALYGPPGHGTVGL